MRRLEVTDLTLDVPGRRLLDAVSFTAEAGGCLAIMGPSGSGKTSLLNCLCGIAVPTSGTISIDGVEITDLGPAERAEFRLRHIGLVFQFGELLPELNAVENVALPLRLMGIPREAAEPRAERWLDRLGLGERAHAHPDVLSGGEVQRVGLARALVHEPALILADEPTGALDEANAREVTGLLIGMAKDLEATVILATHDPRVAAHADRALRLREGRLSPEEASDPVGAAP